MNKIKTITIENNEEFLRQTSRPVKLPDKELEKNIELMDRYFDQSDRTIALASIQLGIPKRLIYLKNTDIESVSRAFTDQKTEEDERHNERRILINPVIISREGLTDYWETCASCLDNMGHVRRPYKIVVEYQDLNGEKHLETFEGFESTVLSHEMDHLDGILHIDIADEVIVMPFEERKVFRQTHGYRIISKDGDYDKLMKKGKLEKIIK